MINKKKIRFLGDLIEVVLNRALAFSVGVKRRYPYVKGYNSGASQKFSWEQFVSCLVRSKEHFKGQVQGLG